MKVLVCGAGINGISTAIWLQRGGAEVTLLDKSDPGQATSYGNAGVLAAGSIIPVTTPGLGGKAHKMLFDPMQPLFLRWAYLPKLLPFLRKYMAHATHEHVAHYAKSMSSLLHDTVDQHRALAAETGAEEYISDHDFCFGYETQAAFEADKMAWDLRRENGHTFEVMSGADYAKKDPFFGSGFEVVVANKNHGKIADPGAYQATLARHFVAESGTLLQGTINKVNHSNGKVASIVTDQGTLEADEFVFTLGPWSGGIAKQLGLKIPFESEGGYHIELVNPSRQPEDPMMVAAGKFVVTGMRGRIRLAGVVEFGGLECRDNAAPVELLKNYAKRLFPDVTYDRIDTWHGFRPTTADSLPVIGNLDHLNNAHVGFGHQHVGLTGGPKTGRLIADHILGNRPNIDMSPFDPQKYA